MKSSAMAAGAVIALIGAGLGLSAARRAARQRARIERSRASSSSPLSAPLRQPANPPRIATAVGRRLNRSAAVLAFSVLADSGVEHYRGAFKNRAMFIPLAASSLTLGASLFGTADERPDAHWARDAIYALAATTGCIGLGFHAYNIGKRPGGFSWLNLFYGAPAGAPFALVLAGLLGRAAERVRETPESQRPTVLDLPAGPLLAGVCSMGLLGTVGEAALLHFRGAYHDPFMFLPVSLPPAAAAFLANAAIQPNPTTFGHARAWLKLAALLGFAGVGFHAFGVSRNMGGWANWKQNLLNGPPLPAPPSFTGLALAGLATVTLLEDDWNA